MVSVKVKNTKAWTALRKSPEVQQDLLARAIAARDAADTWMGVPGSFKVVKEPGKNRARYTVRPNTYAAVRRVAKDPTGFANICLAAGKGS